MLSYWALGQLVGVRLHRQHWLPAVGKGRNDWVSGQVWRRLWLPRCPLVDGFHFFCQVLRQLQQGLAKCYSVAFEKSGAVSDAKITPHTLNFVKKLVSTFGVGLENVSNVSTMFSSAASESLARRAQATAQDPVFQKLKGQFTTGEPCTGHVLLRLC